MTRPALPLDARLELQERPTASTLRAALLSLAALHAPCVCRSPLVASLAAAVSAALAAPLLPETPRTLARAALRALPPLDAPGVARVGGGPAPRHRRPSETDALAAALRDLDAVATWPSRLAPPDLTSLARRVVAVAAAEGQGEAEARELLSAAERWEVEEGDRRHAAVMEELDRLAPVGAPMGATGR